MTPPIEPAAEGAEHARLRDDKPKAQPAFRESRDGLFARTLRTVGLLVAACVLFVGLLSAVAVVITTKAFGPGPSSAEARSKADDAAKKPLSI